MEKFLEECPTGDQRLFTSAYSLTKGLPSPSECCFYKEAIPLPTPAQVYSCLSPLAFLSPVRLGVTEFKTQQDLR